MHTVLCINIKSGALNWRRILQCSLEFNSTCWRSVKIADFRVFSAKKVVAAKVTVETGVDDPGRPPGKAPLYQAQLSFVRCLQDSGSRDRSCLSALDSVPLLLLPYGLALQGSHLY